jgi:hypothetical protein
MNMKEEILKKELLGGGSSNYEGSGLLKVDDAVEIAEAYAKERAWGIWKYLDKQVCRYGGFPFIEEKSRELFEAEYAAQIEELKKEEPK